LQGLTPAATDGRTFTGDQTREIGVFPDQCLRRAKIDENCCCDATLGEPESIFYAVEIYDARSGELLLAACSAERPAPPMCRLSTTKTIEAVACIWHAGTSVPIEEPTQQPARP